MSKFLCKAILFGGFSVRTLAPSPTIDVRPLRWVSSSSNEQSFTVSFLTKSLGFSPQAASLASKHVNFESPENPDKVINLFKKYGFTQIQISSLVGKRPGVLACNSEKTILPKLEFFEAKGISWSTFAQKVCTFPTILFCSLDKKIIPSYEFLRGFFQSDEKTISAIKKYPDILLCIEKYVAPNIEVLRKHGVPDSHIASLIRIKPVAVVVNSDRFSESVKRAVKMGFNASSRSFVEAVATFRSLSESTWESKVRAYKKWGWSDIEVLEAFGRNPACMMLSEDKITTHMNFFVKKMGCKPFQIAENPLLLKLSLEKRLIPRFSVLQALLSKGLVGKASLRTIFGTPEKTFLEKFVTPYKEEAPELIKLYKEKFDLPREPETDEE